MEERNNFGRPNGQLQSTDHMKRVFFSSIRLHLVITIMATTRQELLKQNNSSKSFLHILKPKVNFDHLEKFKTV